MERSVYNNMRRIEEDHWWFRARREIIADQIRRMALGADARVLEVGCGTGGNLQMLSRFGKVTGLEPDQESRTYAQERTGVAVVSGMLPDQLPELGGPFDLIAALDVIEHLDQDAASIASLGGLLRPGGRILTTVPACPWMWSRHDEVHHHKRRYKMDDYLKMFKTAGLRVTAASHFNSLLFPAIALVRIASARGSDATDGGDAIPAAPLNTLLYSIFAFEKHLLKRVPMPFGVSILVVAERPS